MVDIAARKTASAMMTRLELGILRVQEFEEAWPHESADLGVRSIGYFIWTLFSDDEEGCIQVADDHEVRQILANAKVLLSSDDEFIPRQTAPVSKLHLLLAGDKEWRDCELPWHLNWPNRPLG